MDLDPIMFATEDVKALADVADDDPRPFTVRALVFGEHYATLVGPKVALGNIVALIGEMPGTDLLRHEHAEGMRWTCEQAGHPKQMPDDGGCICEIWAHHIERGAVEIVCEPEGGGS